MKEIDLTKLIKFVDNINDITSLNGYNETDIDMILKNIQIIFQY